MGGPTPGRSLWSSRRKKAVPVIAGFGGDGVNMARKKPCVLSAHTLGPFAPNGGIAWSEAAVDEDLLPALVRASVNANSCTSDTRAQCAEDIACDPATGLAAECTIDFVGGGTRGAGARQVVFDVGYDAETGEFSWEYIR